MKPISSSRQEEELRRAFDELRQLEGDERTKRLGELRAARPELGQELGPLLAFAERQSSDGRNLDWLFAGRTFQATDPRDLVGRTVSHFRIQERLGSGGMGVVYRAEDIRLKRTVALKFLSPHLRLDTGARQRLLQEARAASALDHPNICTVFEVDETSDGQTFIAMSCYEGETLEQKLAEGRLPVDLALDYARQVLAGLQVAHECDIIHRDIKPGNLLITNDGTVKILDFGLAKLADGTLTNTGTVVGTAAYMSPEQIEAQEVDARTDLWSLGAVLYEMLSGSKAFAGSYELAVLYSILHSDPSPLPPHVPEHVRNVVTRCLKKDRSERYRSAKEIRADLSRGAGEDKPSIIPAGRRRLIFLGAGVLMLALVVAWGTVNHGGEMYRWMQTALEERIPLPAEKHIVVLPLDVAVEPDDGDRPSEDAVARNISEISDESNNAFAHGLSETLVNKLARLESIEQSFWVVPAQEVIERKIASIEQARDAFGVTLALTGSVRRRDEDIVLTLRLLDASSGRQITAADVRAARADADAFQDRIAETLAAMFQVKSPSAVEILRGAGTIVPGAYDYYITGRGLLRDYDQIENVDEAIDLFERALKADPNYAAAQAALGEALWRKYEHTNETALLVRALAHCDDALRSGEGQVPVHISVAMVRTEIGRYEDAIASLARALEIEPRNADAHLQLARTHQELASVEEPEKNFELAETHFRRAVALKADYWASYSALGRFYYFRGRYEEAVEQFNHALVLAPRNAFTYNRLGTTYAQMERYVDAIEAWHKSVEIEPRHATYLNLGTFYYFVHHDFPRAAEMYQKAIDLNSLDHRAWGWLGESRYWLEGETEEAKNAFTEAIRLAQSASIVNTRDAVVLSRLAVYYAYLDHDEEAARVIGSALETGTSDPEVFARAAEVYVLIDRPDIASDFVARALENGYPRLYVDRSPLLQGINTAESTLPAAPHDR